MDETTRASSQPEPSLSDVRHSMRASLTNLTLYLDLLASGPVERRRHYLEVISAEVERMAGLIDRCRSEDGDGTR
jgi:signal transduction histidine kinase